MKVKVSILDTSCILMPGADTVARLLMMASTVSEESLARNTHTHTHTDSGSVVYVKVVKVAYDYENKKWTD